MIDWDGNGKITPTDIGISLAALNERKGLSIMLAGYEFTFLQELEPQRDITGEIKLLNPQYKYEKKSKKQLNKYGEGPFCSFRINNGNQHKKMAGVYALLDSDDCLLYIGQTVNLEQRFNSGYGNIQPINCYVGGQTTNCKINKMILNKYLCQRKVYLYFLCTIEYDRIEHELISQLKPPFNSDLSFEKGDEPLCHNAKKQSDMRDTNIGTGFEKLWARIIEHQNEKFILTQGKSFQYMVRGNAVYPLHITGAVPKTEFIKAYNLMMINSVKQLRDNGIQMPSYVYAIMRDERIGFFRSKYVNASIETKRPKTSMAYDFSTNDKVEHRTFGKGIVMGIKQMGNDVIVEVQFEDGSSRKLMQRVAQLKRL